MRRGYILSGSQFGDEGKGTFVDYIANEKGIKRNIRYNGGSQAAHTVVLEDGVAVRFSQLGSSMLIPGNKCLEPSNKRLSTILSMFCVKSGFVSSFIKKEVTTFT